MCLTSLADAPASDASDDALALAGTQNPSATIAEIIATADLDSLLEIRANALAQVERAREVRDLVERVLAKRMIADGAATYFHPEYDVTYSPGPSSYQYESEILGLKLQQLASEGKCDPAQVRKAVEIVAPEPFTKINTVSLKALAKYGGEVAAAIEAHTRKIEGEPRLVIKAKKSAAPRPPILTEEQLRAVSA